MIQASIAGVTHGRASPLCRARDCTVAWGLSLAPCTTFDPACDLRWCTAARPQAAEIVHGLSCAGPAASGTPRWCSRVLELELPPRSLYHPRRGSLARDRSPERNTLSTPSGTDDPTRVVAAQTRRGISWNLAGAVVTNAMRVVVIVVLGRLLDADDFGVVAAAVSVAVILHGLRDVGLGQALIQRRELARGHATTAFAVSTYLGLILAAVLVLGAPTIGALYRMPASVDVIRALAVLFALRGVAQTSRMLAQREMAFRAIAIIDASSFAIGSIAAIAGALADLGPWALVLGYLVEEVLATVMYMWVCPPPWAWRIDGRSLRELMSFGAGQTVAQLAGILATYGDNFVVGGALGERSLGLYTRAYDLIKFPSTVFASIVGSVLFPALSRLQDDRRALATAFRRVTFANALVLLPASTLLAVLAPEAIVVLVGHGWDDAVLPFQILALTMLLRTSQKAGAIVAQAAGLVNGVAKAYLVYLVLVVGGAALSVRWGIAGVASSTALAIAVVSALCSALALRASGMSSRELLAAHGHGLALSAVVLAVTWPLARLLRGGEGSVVTTFVITTAAAVGPCVIVAGWWLRRGTGDFGWLLQELGRLTRRRRPAGAEVP
ncbi:MAG: lipopolysaccharide biosynthesis protein [Kofleriaceae bacterium]